MSQFMTSRRAGTRNLVGIELGYVAGTVDSVKVDGHEHRGLEFLETT